MLNDFSNTKLDAQKPTEAPKAAPSQPAPESSKAAPSSDPQANPEDAFSEEEFAKQLQAGMAELLGDLEKSVGYGYKHSRDTSLTTHSLICSSSSRKCSSR